jgi:hypothetical protein
LIVTSKEYSLVIAIGSNANGSVRLIFTE